MHHRTLIRLLVITIFTFSTAALLPGCKEYCAECQLKMNNGTPAATEKHCGNEAETDTWQQQTLATDSTAQCVSRK